MTATATVTRSAPRDTDDSLRARLGVERELGHAERLNEIDDVHDVAVGDAPIRRDDRLQLRIALQQSGHERAYRLLVGRLAVSVELVAAGGLPLQRQRQRGALGLLAGGRL